MARLNLIFLGPPGAGKGTQAEIIAKRFHLTKLSTGDILRDAVRQGTPLGRQAQQYMEKGELVPDDVMLGLVEETLDTVKEGFILDGFPRTLQQAKGLEKILKDRQITIHHVILLQVPDEEIIRRLSARRVCPQCKATYNLLSHPPKEDERCDHCGVPLITRPDDKPETIQKRLDVYRKQTAPLIEYYKERGLLREVSGIGNPEAVTYAIEQVLRNDHPQNG